MRQHSIPWGQAGPHAHQRTQTADTRTPTTVDLVVPVYNEETALAASVETLLRATSEGDSHVTIIIADNASTDSTPTIAETLVAKHPNVRYVRLEQKGRGRALSTVWSASSSDVVAYTDVDLATDVRALAPMVEVIRSGIADVAIASRLLPGLAISRGVKREVISRCYNRLLGVSLGVGYSDAQCGFKAMSAKSAKMLLPMVEDTEWFFDTELLTRAEWAGLRIHEFGTDWVDDPNSSVDVLSTAWSDVRGIVRLRRSTRNSSEISLGINEVPAPNTGAQILHFIDVGIVSTLLYAVLFLCGVQMLSPAVANLGALLVSTVANTGLNRRHTFGVRAPHHGLAAQVKGLAAFALCLAFTSAGLALTSGFTGPLATIGTLTVLTLANLLATIVRFVLLRTWVFAISAHRNSRRPHHV
ncbi:glycosyltransferase [Brevibacterium sp. UCMA 11752]|uniref:glycosyltransferase n=1 Tax=Brevibacterium sp. UCMA 11752 TaxID=2745946 RepID=UPI001F352213|nr:glycosyltransferase [Brevibacterium sp. UCMA 11752]MCF2588889.1 glycosyltransferase [Brevibacterium sp. UCMA 11752]